jgi:hypothetical protein
MNANRQAIAAMPSPFATIVPQLLCQEHALVLADPVTAQYPVCKTVILPLRARVFLCSTCRGALQQTIENSSKASAEHRAPAIVARRDAVTV